MKKVNILLIILIFISQTIFAGEIKLPQYERKVLKNGLTLLAMENSELPLVSFRVTIKSGGVFDPNDKIGLANFVSEIIRKGTKTRTATQISEQIEFVGGILNTSVDYDYSIISCEVLSKDIDTGLDLLSDVILNPVFAKEEIERLREQITGEIRNEKDDNTSIAEKNYAKFLYGGHPYSRPLLGTEESVGKITRDDLTKFYSDYYVANNAILAVVGDFKTKDIISKIEKFLGKWNNKDIKLQKFPEAPKNSARKVLIVEKKDVTQTQIRIGNLAVPRKNPDYFPIIVGNTILGGGFTSWLVDEIRVNRGLSYSASSNFRMRKEPGDFTIRTFTKNPTTLETIKVALEQVDRLERGDIPQDRLEGAKNYILGLYPQRMETNEGLANLITDIEFHGLDKDFVTNFAKNVRAVTINDIKRISEKYINPNSFTFVVVSNTEQVLNDMKTLGSVEIWDLSGNKIQK